MSYKKFIKLFFLSALTVILGAGAINYYIDPYWTFSHSNYLNSVQNAPNERQQKSNYLYFRDKSYDSLLLGSSRVTFFNQYDFKNLNTFNYSFSLAMPKEYEPYIEFAKKCNKKDFKYIFIGVDFFGSNGNFDNNTNPKEIFKNTTSCCYRVKMLFSIDALHTSLFNIKASLQRDYGKRSYDRDNITYTSKISPQKVEKIVENEKVKNYQGDILHFKYNENYKEIFKSIKAKNPNSKIVIFTTPTSSFYLKKIFSMGLKDEYKRWLRELVEVNGEIYHFMDFNTITDHYENYFIDYHHLQPRFTTLIVDRVLGLKNENLPHDFGKVLNRENIEKYLDKI
jgi:hypothetical protein